MMNMRKYVSVIIALLLSVGAFAQISFGEKLKINDGWFFSLDGSTQRPVNLPHDWSIECEPSQKFASCTGYLPGGYGVYKKKLFIDRSQKGLRQYLYFEGVYCCSSVYVNGNFCGTRPSGFASFVYDITPFVKYGEENDIKVTVDHSEYADSRYYTGSGIYRDVYLITCGQVHIDNWGVHATTPEVSRERASLNIKTKIVNDGKKKVEIEVEQRLYAKGDEVLVASSKKNIIVPPCSIQECEQELEVLKPDLWSIINPALYSLSTTIYNKGKLVDDSSTRLGIRELKFDADKGFFLNGLYTKLKGVCLHRDAGSLGAIVPKSILRERLTTLRSLGCNAIRMSHNPQAEMIYDLCDEMGFLVIDEAFDEWMSPKRKWVEGWNKGKHPSLNGYAEYFNSWAEQDLRDMVMRDRNHPSIIMWSIGNEIDYPNDPYTHPVLDYEGINQKTTPGFKPERERAEVLGPIAEKLALVVRENDVSRPVTAALAGVVMSNYTGYPSALDVVGYNYTEFRYEEDHKRFPNRILYGSENRHDYPAWKAVDDNEYILGQFLWTGFDYLGEAKVWPSRGSHAGLLDYCGKIKPRGWYRKTLWTDDPCVYVGTKKSTSIGSNTACYDWTSTWNYESGDTICIAVMSNCEKLELSINGRKVSQGPVYQLNSNAHCWFVPFEIGELTCTGISSEGKMVKYTIESVGEAERCKICVHRTELLGNEDVTQVDVELLDAKYRLVRKNGVPITFSASGDVSILRLENNNPQFHDCYFGGETKSYEGRATAYISSLKQSGKGSVIINCLGKEEVVDFDIIPRDGEY